MAKVEKVDPPIGWLIDPHKKWAIQFDFKKLSNDKVSSDFTIDMWGVDPSGKPMKFKGRRKVTRDESIKAWKHLLSSNWIEFDLEKDKIA